MNTGYNFGKDVKNMYVAGYRTTASSNSCKKTRGEVVVSVCMPKDIWQEYIQLYILQSLGVS